MDKPIENLLKESLKEEAPPELSPFFSTRLINKIKSKEKPNPLGLVFLLVYWGIFSFFTLSMLSTLNWASWAGTILIVVLIPVSFLFPVISHTRN